MTLLADKPDDLSLIAETQVEEGDKELYNLFPAFHTCTMECTKYTHRHTPRQRYIHRNTHRYTCRHTDTHIVTHRYMHTDMHRHTQAYTQCKNKANIIYRKYLHIRKHLKSVKIKIINCAELYYISKDINILFKVQLICINFKPKKTVYI